MAEQQSVRRRPPAVPLEPDARTLPPTPTPTRRYGRAVTVTVRYFAAARAAAGLAEEQLSVPVAERESGAEHPEPGDATTVECAVGAVLDAAVHRHGQGLANVLLRCSYLLDEIAVHGPTTPVRDGQVLDVLPPFAGG